MKKTVSFIVSIVILSTCLMCGCGKTDNSKGKKGENTDEETVEIERKRRKKQLMRRIPKTRKKPFQAVPKVKAALWELTLLIRTWATAA